MHLKPAKYYELVLSNRNVHGLHDRLHFGMLKDADFAKMLRGEKVALKTNVCSLES